MNMELAWPRIVLFGDSLTQFSFGEGGWGASITDKLQRKCDVLNRGFSGYNSRWNLLALPRLFPDARSLDGVAAFIVFLGANDSNKAELNPVQHVPAEEYQENLKAIVEYLQGRGVAKEKVILVGPPPCDVLAWEKACQTRGVSMAKDNGVAQLYNDKCREAAKDSGAEFLDLYTCMMSRQDWSACLSDGLHLSKAGSGFLFELLWPKIDARTRELRLMLPEWHSVNSNNPSESFS